MKIRWTLGLLIICVLLVINIGELAAEKTWTPRADMPTARYNFGTCVVDVYDPATDTWAKAKI